MSRTYKAKIKVSVFGEKTEGRELLASVSRVPYSSCGFDSVMYGGQMYPVYWNSTDGNFIQLSKYM